MIIKIFLFLVKLSLLSFGGGYAMIPIMISTVEKNKWATVADMTDVVAVGAMAPGPVAVNTSVGLGYMVGKIPGVIAAFLGITIPCVIIVIVVAKFFMKMNENKVVKGIMYGLKAVIPGIILYAGVKMAIQNNIINLNITQNGFFQINSLILIGVNYLLLSKTKTHPIFLIIGSAVYGIVAFS